MLLGLVLRRRPQPFFRRTYSTPSKCSALETNCSVYVSTSHDPYFNLSIEDWLFRHKDPKDPLLLLYRNNPCVVIGRNQNPWKEVNLQQSSHRSIPFLRRRSGGGTVFHVCLFIQHLSLTITKPVFRTLETPTTQSMSLGPPSIGK